MKFKLAHFCYGIEEARYHANKNKTKKNVIQWNNALNSLIHVFSILMNVAKNLRNHHDIQREMSSSSSSSVSFTYSHFLLEENEEKSPLLASLLNIWFERSTTNFLSLNKQSYNRQRWNLIMIIIPIRYDFVLLHFSHVLFSLSLSLSLSLYLMRLSPHPNVVRAFCTINIKTCHQSHINIDISWSKKKEKQGRLDPNCYSNIFSLLWSNHVHMTKLLSIRLKALTSVKIH